MPLTRAIIVEPRNHPALEYVVVNVATKTDRPITIVHGTANKLLANEIALRHDYVSLVSLNVDDLNATTYSNLLRSDQFWCLFDAEDQVLVFQTDSAICGGMFECEFGVELEDADYCAAPNSHHNPYFNLDVNLTWVATALIVAMGGVVASSSKLSFKVKMLNVVLCLFGIGCLVMLLSWFPRKDVPLNGGFSLRRVSVMRKLIRENRDRSNFRNALEDVAFTDACAWSGQCHLCTLPIAKRFAVDTSTAHKTVKLPWAFHKHYDQHVVAGCEAAIKVQQLNIPQEKNVT